MSLVWNGPVLIWSYFWATSFKVFRIFSPWLHKVDPDATHLFLLTGAFSSMTLQITAFKLMEWVYQRCYVARCPRKALKNKTKWTVVPVLFGSPCTQNLVHLWKVPALYYIFITWSRFCEKLHWSKRQTQSSFQFL